MAFLAILTILIALAIICLVVWAATHDPFPAFLGILALIAMPIWWLAMSFSQISAGYVGVATYFGEVQKTVYGEGLWRVGPLYSITQLSIQRQTVDFSKPSGNNTNTERDADPILSISADRNTLTVQVQFPYQINPDLAWKLYQKIGDNRRIEQTLILPAARAAVRDVIAAFAWADAAGPKRNEVEAQMLDNLRRSVVSDLTEQGWTADEAKRAFQFLPTQLREVLPDLKVQNAIAERLAADENLARQKVLTEIAKQEAERRAQEGTGVSRLFEQLPKGFKASEIRDVLLALAEKERADALTKAVEGGKITFMVIPSNTPVAVHAQ